MDTTICAKCGACSTVCPVFQATGREELTARGRLHLLGKMAEGHHSSAWLEIFSKCLLCGACHEACPRSIDLPSMVATARRDLPVLSGVGSFGNYLAGRCLAHPRLLAGLGNLFKHSGPVLRQLPENSGLRLKLGIFADAGQGTETREKRKRPSPPDNPGTARDGIAVFGGCLALHLLPDINLATEKLLGSSFCYTPTAQVCCGLAAYSNGDFEDARRLARLNITAFEDFSGPIVTGCASCYSHLSTYEELLAEDPVWLPRARDYVGRLRELSGWLADRLVPTHNRSTGTKKIRVLFHDPCHLRRHPELRQAVRCLLKSRPDLELVELPGGSRCCGLGGTFNLTHPDISRRIAQPLTEEITALSPDLLLTSCSGCLLQLHSELVRTGSSIEIRHLASFLADF